MLFALFLNCTKQKTAQKRKTLVVFWGGVHGEGGKGEDKREQHWFCWGSSWGGEGAGVNVQSSWRGRRASPALDPNSGVGGVVVVVVVVLKRIRMVSHCNNLKPNHMTLLIHACCRAISVIATSYCRRAHIAARFKLGHFPGCFGNFCNRGVW